ncbi:acyl carrier protein [Aerococcaceae bacterium DSM 111020]|nr:acyl carrier protein [Aerococcaceae bacterium DSM 111020]
MVFDKVKEIIAEELGIDEGTITLETNFQEDLEADSLDLFQVISELEDEFDITIDTEEGLETVSDLVKFIEAEQAN